MFNIIQFDIEGRRVLDLFAGTGQLGIECLSRGARSATFVDQRSDAVRLIRENLKLTQLEERAAVLLAEYAAALSAGEQSPYSKYREYRYGKIKITVYHRD